MDADDLTRRAARAKTTINEAQAQYEAALNRYRRAEAFCGGKARLVRLTVLVTDPTAPDGEVGIGLKTTDDPGLEADLRRLLAKHQARLTRELAARRAELEALVAPAQPPKAEND